MTSTTSRFYWTIVCCRERFTAKRQAIFFRAQADFGDREAGGILDKLDMHDAIARDELLSSVWRLSPKGISTRTIDMHIARLREKLRENKDTPTTLLTVRGKGYMWAQSKTNMPPTGKQP